MRRGIVGKRKQKAEPGDGFKMRIQLTANNQSFTLPLTTTGSPQYDFTILWGDGTSSTVTSASDANRIHTYSALSGANFDIEIQGRCDRLYFNFEGSRLLVRKILSWGGDDFDGFTNMGGAFYGCSNLNELAAVEENIGIKERLPIADFSYFVASCSALTSLPTDLLRYNTSANNMLGAFLSLSNLTTLPANLFYYNPLVTNYYFTFGYNYQIQLRNDMLNTDSFLNKSIDWRGFAFRVSAYAGTAGTMQNIWDADYGTGTPNIGTGSSRPFAGEGNSTTSISNYNDIPSAWGGGGA